MPLRTAGLKHRSLMPCLFFTLALVFSAQSVFTTVCSASVVPTTNLIFILDGSGSMGALVQGKTKMDVAKEVLSGLIGDLPGGVNVGLVAYGHREKADCNDVEELAPLGPLDKNGLISKIKNINPKGKTPITISVQKVAESVRTLEDEVTIILVSDGEETCEGDPCSFVRELKASGIKFVMHVIGFDVNEKEKAQLSCVAEAGGCSYFSAKSAGEFSLAAKRVVEKTEKSAGKLKVAASRNGKSFSAYCTVYRAGGDDDKEREKVADDWTGAEGKAFKLSPGVYDVVVENVEDAGKPVIQFQGITIEAGKNIEKVADFSGGTLKVRASRNSKPFSAYASIYKAGGDENKEKERVTDDWTGTEGKAFKLSPGVYDLDVENTEDAGKPVVQLQGITIEAGKSVEKVADFSGGTLKVKALRNGKPFSAYATIYKAGGGEDKEREKVIDDWTGTEGKAFKLSPGGYDVVVENTEDGSKPVAQFQGITVEAGKSVEQAAEFFGGTLKVKASRNGKPFSAYCFVYKAGDDEEREREQVGDDWTGTEGKAFKLSPGVYDVIFENSESGEKKELKGIAIEADRVQNADVQF